MRDIDRRRNLLAVVRCDNIGIWKKVLTDGGSTQSPPLLLAQSRAKGLGAGVMEMLK